MNNARTYRPFFQLCLWQAYYLHPAEIDAGDLIDATGRPNAIKTLKQEEFAADPARTKNYSVNDDLEITPSGTSERIMQKANILYRAESSGFSLWLRARAMSAGKFQPHVPLDTPFKLTFAIRAKNPAFFNFTDLDTNTPTGAVYYFSNRADNRFLNTNYLNATPAQLSPPQNYASALDRVPVRANTLSVDVAALQTDFVRFVLINPLTPAEIVFEKTAEEDFLKTCSIPGIPSGLYELKAFARNGSEIPSLKRTFFWNAGDIPSDAFGIVEIFHLPGSLPPPYALLGADQQLLSPVYTLWWQNRSTFWRYLFDLDQPAPDAAHPDCSVKLEDPNLKKQLLSKSKQPLVNTYRKMFFRKTNSSENILLPNPAPDRIYLEGADYYSEIHLNKTDFEKIIPGTS